MKITIKKDDRKRTGWITLDIDGKYQAQAKVYDEPSELYGINGGRVSKLWIATAGPWSSRRELYSYDRGGEVDRAPAGLVDAILEFVGN